MRIRAMILVLAAAGAFVGCDWLGTKDAEQPVDPITLSKTYNLTVNSSTSANVLTELGREPDGYAWLGTDYTKTTLPTGPYIMSYKRGNNSAINFLIDNASGGNVLAEVRIESAGAGYSCLGGALTLGTTLADALTALGPPASAVDGQPKPSLYAADVLYTNIDGTTGRHVYRNSAHGICIFFTSGSAIAIYIYAGTEKVTRE